MSGGSFNIFMITSVILKKEITRSVARKIQAALVHSIIAKFLSRSIRRLTTENNMPTLIA
jgi:hypothetical protein